MKITFCGGAQEVGASCYLLKLDGKNILLDCGIRMKGGKDSLPDFSRIQEAGGVDAIIISHAHLDHTGSLPVISREYPNALIYMTHATKDLIKVLLYDSLKIMNNNEAEIPIYAENHVQDMLKRIVCYSPQYNIYPFNDKNIKVTFYNAGHIAGAASIYIQGEEGALFYTGDISGVDQQTVNGASLPKLRPDVVITESTYGDKLHSNRQIEEERLIEKVKETISNGGKMLVPAFALGRAQEIILILKKAINKKTLPEFKIYIDGMVKDINRAYKLNPNYLKRNLAKKIFKGNEIFYDDNVLPVTDTAMREEIVSSKDGVCIISSSGMLKGGPSSWYAEKLAADEKNFIAITGYQDEEAPGREILELIDSEDEDRKININGKSIPLKCKVGKFGLSAHGDKGELLGIIHKISPRKIFLVHGDKEIIQSLSKEMNREVRARIYVPANGEEYQVSFKNPRKQLSITKDIKPLNKDQELTEENIETLWKHIYTSTGTDIGYSAEDLITIWTGNEDFTEADVRKITDTLNSSRYFEPNSRRLFLYHPVAEEELQEDDGVMEMNEMLTFIDEIFPQEAGIYKKGARYEEKIAILYFNFPRKSKEKYSNLIREFEEKSGWKVEINDDCNQGAAEELIYNLVPKDANINKLSYYRDKGYFLIDLDKPIKDMDKLQTKFEEITGLKLIESQSSSKKIEEISLKEVDGSNIMEQNKAFSLIDAVFKFEDHKVYKKSRKESGGIPYIELSFITPQIGERYKETIKGLEDETGWNILVGQNPNQNEIIKITKTICREKGINLKKNPSIHINEKLVKIKSSNSIDEDILNKAKEEFMQMVGYQLEIE